MNNLKVEYCIKKIINSTLGIAVYALALSFIFTPLVYWRLTVQ
jgi:uncharacterized protein involved in outer membrane biogenesis